MVSLFECYSLAWWSWWNWQRCVSDLFMLFFASVLFHHCCEFCFRWITSPGMDPMSFNTPFSTRWRMSGPNPNIWRPSSFEHAFSTPRYVSAYLRKRDNFEGVFWVGEHMEEADEDRLVLWESLKACSCTGIPVGLPQLTWFVQGHHQTWWEQKLAQGNDSVYETSACNLQDQMSWSMMDNQQLPSHHTVIMCQFLVM
jgi:hypothetical protein